MVISQLAFRHCESGGRGQRRRGGRGLERRVRLPMQQQAAAGGVEPTRLRKRAECENRLAALLPPVPAAALHPVLHQILVGEVFGSGPNAVAGVACRPVANPLPVPAEEPGLLLEVFAARAGAQQMADRLDGPAGAVRIVAQNVAVILEPRLAGLAVPAEGMVGARLQVRAAMRITDEAAVGVQLLEKGPVVMRRVGNLHQLQVRSPPERMLDLVPELPLQALLAGLRDAPEPAGGHVRRRRRHAALGDADKGFGRKHRLAAAGRPAAPATVVGRAEQRRRPAGRLRCPPVADAAGDNRRPALVEALEGPALDAAGKRQEPVAQRQFGPPRIGLQYLGHQHRQLRTFGHGGECIKRPLHHVRKLPEGIGLSGSVCGMKIKGCVRHRSALLFVSGTGPDDGVWSTLTPLQSRCFSSVGDEKFRRFPSRLRGIPESRPDGITRSCPKLVSYRQIGTTMVNAHPCNCVPIAME